MASAGRLATRRKGTTHFTARARCESPRGAEKPRQFAAGFRDGRLTGSPEGTVQRGSVVDPFDIDPFAGVDFEHVADLDETGDGEFGTGFDLGRFGDVGRGVTLGPGLAIDHFELDVGRRFEDDRLLVEEGQRAGHAVLEVLPSVAGDFGGNFVLFERLAIHEDVGFALAVEVLDIGLFDVGTFQLVAPFVGSIEGGAADQVPHPAFVKRVALTRFDEVHFDHQIGFTVDLNFEAFAKIAGIVRCHWELDSVCG